MVSRGRDGKSLGLNQKKFGIAAPKNITTHINGCPEDKYVAVRNKDEAEKDSDYSCQLPHKKNKEKNTTPKEILRKISREDLENLIISIINCTLDENCILN